MWSSIVTRKTPARLNILPGRILLASAGSASLTFIVTSNGHEPRPRDHKREPCGKVSSSDCLNRVPVEMKEGPAVLESGQEPYRTSPASGASRKHLKPCI